MKYSKRIKENYKLFEIIGSLSDKEVRQIRKMLRSPFFTQRPEVQQLFEMLAKSVKKGHKFPEVLALTKSLFANPDHAAVKLRGAMSDLKKFIEEYWCIQYLRTDKIKMHLMISEFYRRRKLQKCYHSNLKRVDQLLEGHPKRNAEYYQLRLEFETDRMKYQSATKRTENLFLQEISDTSDILYLIQKLQTSCAQLSHQLVYKTTYDKGLLNNLIKDLEQSKYLKNPAVAIFYYCFRFLTEPEKINYFHSFKTILSKHRHQFSDEDLGAPYRLAINLCIRNSNQGDLNFTRDGWELYKEGLKSGVLLENKVIPRFTFNNVIALALLLKELDWTASFIQQNSDQLEDIYKIQTLKFNWARLEFTRKNYDEALLHLQSESFKDLINNLISRMLTVKIFYELNAVDALTAQLDTLDQYVRRKEVSEYHRINFLNTIKYVRRLLSIPEYDKQARLKLRRQIQEEKIMSEKKWLIEKCA